MPRSLPALACSLLLACGGETSGNGSRATAPLEPTTRDSAGVTIHEHAADALERAPLIVMDSVPIVVFGGSVEDVEGDVSSLSQFSFTSTGELAAFDRAASQIVVLPDDGGARRAFGRPGAGPGEIGRYGSLTRVTGDTLVFRDGANNRLAIVSPREGMLRELSLAGRGAGGISQLFGRDSTGTFFFLRWSMASLPPDAPSAHRQPVMLQSWRGGSDSIVDHFVGGEIRLWREVITRGPGVSVLTRSAALTVEPQFRIWGDKLLVASGGEWRLDRRDPNGAHLGSYRVNRSAAPLTDSVWSQYVDQVVASRVAGDSTLDRSAVREQLAAEEHEGSLPAFETVVVTPDQTAWALDYRLPGDSGWAATAFDLRGRILGRIVEPRGDPPVAFGNDRLAFRTEDEDGIATITVRRIRMPE